MTKKTYTYQQFGNHVAIIYEDDHAICVARYDNNGWIIMTDPPINDVRRSCCAGMGWGAGNIKQKTLHGFMAELNERDPYTEDEIKMNIAKRVVKYNK